MMNDELLVETLEAPDELELLQMIDDFMHDKLIIDTQYFNKNCGVHIIYIPL